MANLIYFDDQVNDPDAGQMVSFSRLVQWTNAGSEHPIGDALSDNAGYRMG
jgi:hypothetical protein